MDGLTITSFPQGKAFLSGESLRVNTLFSNRSDALWEVPTPDEPSPLRYELRAEAGGRAYHVSHDDLVTLLRNEPPDRWSPTELHPIAPGANLLRSEDIAELSSEPFAPGRYVLISYHRQGGALLSSRPAPVEIVPPRVEAAASAFCAVRGGLASALAHRQGDGRALLLARESYRGQPALGVFKRIAELPGDAPVRDLRVFLDTADIVGGRWIAWVREGRVHARKAWGSAVEQALDAIGPSWDHLRLVGPGFQRGDASGLALVVGEEGGRSLVAAMRLGQEGAEILWEAPLPEAPEALAASWDSGDRPWLLWSAPGAVRALAGGPGAAAARTIYRLDGPLAAWSVPAVTRTGPTRIALLERPTARGALRLHTTSLDGGSSAAREIAPPPDDVAQWALLDAADGGAPWILAASAGRLLAARAEGAAAWNEIGRVAPAAPYLQAYLATGGVAWAEWDDPALGLRRAVLPA